VVLLAGVACIHTWTGQCKAYFAVFAPLASAW